jgi:AcrR family transcriptional regulator
MTEKRRRGRPRREDADADILRVARELLAERGFAAFNVDVIAERTGIAKTTIYRRWPTKSALLVAAIDTAPTATDARAILEETAALLAGIDDLEVIRAIIVPRRERLREALAPRSDAASLADMLIGALLTRLVTREEFADAFLSIPS